MTTTHSELETQDTGHFEFAPPGRPPIKVYYATGSGDLSTARVIVVMHGTNRNADDYRDAWASLVEDRHLVVLVPEFSEEMFPGTEGYNLGDMVDEHRHPLPRSRWAFGYIEPMVHDFVRRLGGTQTTYDMFGHSAGAQFVHRYLEFDPGAHVRRAVAANAGWYTMPDNSVDFPYGTGHLPTEAHVDWRTFYGRHLTILLGGDDVLSENMRQDPQANRQGTTRLARGHDFFRTAEHDAARRHLPFAWQLKVVPGVGHEYEPMSAQALPILEP